MESFSRNPFYDELKLYCSRGGGRGEEDRDSIGPLYKSIHFQRGYGIGYVDPFPYETYGLGFGDSISNLFRMALPYLKQGLKHLGKKAVDTVANVAHDVIEGRNIPEAAKEHVTTATQELIAKAPKALTELMNKNKQISEMPISSRANVAPRRTTGKRKQAGKKRGVPAKKRGSEIRAASSKYPGLHGVL